MRGVGGVLAILVAWEWVDLLCDGVRLYSSVHRLKILLKIRGSQHYNKVGLMDGGEATATAPKMHEYNAGRKELVCYRCV